MAGKPSIRRRSAAAAEGALTETQAALNAAASDFGADHPIATGMATWAYKLKRLMDSANAYAKAREAGRR